MKKLGPKSMAESATDADKLPEFNPRARAALLQGLEDQLRSPETPEVAAELQRLRSLGVPEKNAKEAMALVLITHIARMIKHKTPFDYSAYLADLRRLPEFDMDQPI